ncbi:MAG TPA: YggT family protein [Pseudolysinimonas sp.]|nr:YggT family protein [Pseudolysinimonas sp.]
MGIVPFLATIAYVALVIFVVLMWTRLIVDWVRALRPRWRPTGVALVAAEAAFAVTDPPIGLVRRVVKPVRFGSASIDFGWSIVFVATLVLLYILGPLRYLAV